LCLSAASRATAVSTVMSTREKSTSLLALVKLTILTGEFLNLLTHVA